jgi:subtilisin family serine protease
VTLVTGDEVTVTPAEGGRFTVAIRPGAGRERVGFHTFESAGVLRVLPGDAVPLVADHVLDLALFDVRKLIAEGYGDNEPLPLIVQQAPSAKAKPLPGTQAVRRLASIDSVAVRTNVAARTTFWNALAAGGVTKVWLDRKVHPVLHQSVAQIGAPSVWRSGYDGTGVDVAVLDTGVDARHPDLAGQLEAVRNFTDSADSVDRYGHGTHVAAIVAGTGAASNGPRKGVAPGADLLVGKVLNDEGLGYDSWIIAGMEWAAASGAEIVNLSLGGDPTDGTDPLSQAVNRLTAETDTLFVVAAGNAGPGAQSVGTPGVADAALTVGAVDRDESIAPFSSRGPRAGDHAVKPDLTAPGVGIVAARATGTSMGTPVDRNYVASSGTSMAAPHVAGVAALAWQRYPRLHAKDLKDLITSTTRHNGALRLFDQGTGRVDARRAVSQHVFATGTLDFGTHRIPSTGRVTRPVRLVNTGTTSVTLDLSLDIVDLDTARPATDAFLLARQSVVVAPGATTAVPVTFDPRGLGRSRLGGWLVATGTDGVTTRTSVAATLRGAMHEVTVRMRNRAGEPETSPVVAFFGDSVDSFYLTWIPPALKEKGVTLEIEEGSYLLHALGLDGVPLDEQSTLFTNPEVEITGSRTIELDMRQATRVRIETPKPAEHQAWLSYYATRTFANGHQVVNGVQEFSTTQALNVTPTPTPRTGTYEFASRWQLVAPMVRTSVRGVTDPLDVNLLHSSPVWNGRRRFALVTAGRGTPSELAATNVRGKALLLRHSEPFSAEAEQAQVDAAAAAGAATVLIQRPADWSAATDWRPVGPRLALPAMVVAYDDAERMLARAHRGGASIALTLTTSSPYLYDVFHVERGRVPERVVHRVTTRNTAQLKVRYTHAGGLPWAKEQRYGWRPTISFAFAQLMHNQRFVATPMTRVEWISANDSIWQQHATYDYGWNDMGALTASRHPATTYRPGQKGSLTWFGPVVRPATPRATGSPVSSRTGNVLALRIPEFVDAQGNYLVADGAPDAVSAELWRGGTKLADLPNAYRNVEVGAADEVYRLRLRAQRAPEDGADWLWATRTDTTWTFRSARTTTSRPLPLLQLDYAVPADLEGQVARRGHRIGLDVRYPPGLPAPRQVRVEADVSFDEGATWQALRLVGHGPKRYASVPRHAGTVSLRVRAEDGMGAKIDQTILRAYGLR